MKKIKKFVKITIKNIFIVIFFTVFIIIILETIFYFLNQKNIVEKYSFESDNLMVYKENIGYVGTASSSLRTAKFLKKDGSVIYDIDYVFDEFNRRQTPKKPNSPHLLIFGGSFASGGGLENNQTLPYFLSDLTNYQVYDYSWSGWGPHQMLAHLERADLSSEILNSDGVAIYIFIPDHIRRAIGDMQVTNWPFMNFAPYYYLNDDKLIRDGNFKTGRPLVTWIYKTVLKSNSIKYFNINLPSASAEHTYLTYKIIKQAKIEYLKQFNGKFYVLIHPLQVLGSKLEPDSLITLLQKNNIDILQYAFKKPLSQYRIPNDGHPTEEFNKILADLIAQDLND